MADGAGSSQEKEDQDQFGAAEPGRKNARKKIRPTYSCLQCHKRKVKCDRVKPCGACCLRGTPSECEYGNSKQDRHFIEQSTVIENLLQSCETLKHELEETRTQANLPPVKQEDTPSPHNVDSFDAESSGKPGERKALVHSGTQTDSQGHSLPSSPVRLTSSGATSSKIDLQKEKKNLSNPTLARALMELFIERLIGEFSPANASNFGGTIRLRQAAEMRVFSPMLCNAFEAASLTFAGSRQQNRSLEMVGHARYIRVLRQLQSALYHPEKSQATDALTVVLLSTIIEAFKQSSKDSILKHQVGGLQLLRSRTPYRHRYGLERSLFVDLRLYWVTAAIALRKPTFLASREWLTVPWLGDSAPKDILHRALDIAVDIPEYLSEVDTFTSMLKDATASTELISLQTTIWDKATEIKGRLQLWETTHVRTYPNGGPWEALEPIAVADFPVFKCRNPSSLETFTPRDLVYPDLLLATSMNFFWAMRLIISPTDGGLPSVLTMQDRYESACNICRSMKYYVQNIPGALVSRMIFVLQTAYESFADGTIEKQFVKDLFLFIDTKLNIRFLAFPSA